MAENGDVFAALASPVRRRLLGLLLEAGPLPVQQLAAHFAMSRPSVSEHLKVLKDAGLVREHKTGRHRYYQIDPEPLQELSRWLTPYERFWRQKLASLRDLLDEPGGPQAVDDQRTIRVDQFLAHPPDRVWQALTDPVLLARWLMPNDFRPVTGHRFTFLTEPRPDAAFDGVVHCQVLAIEPGRLLRISWRAGLLDTNVTWTLVPEGRGTRLFLEHDGFDPDDPVQQSARRIMGTGWRSNVMSALDAVLSTPR